MNEMNHTDPQTGSDRHVGYEKKDIHVRSTVIWTIITVVVLTVMVVGLDEYFTYVKEQQYYESVLALPSQELLDLLAQEELELNSYELIDSARGLYRIPVDSAIELVLREAGVAGTPGEEQK